MADNVVPIRPGMPARPEPDRELIREDLQIARGMLIEAEAHARDGNDEPLTEAIGDAKDHTDVAWRLAGGTGP